MNLFELEEKRDDAQADVNFYRREVARLEAKAGVKATDYSNELATGTSRNSKEDVYLQLAQMSMDLDDAISKLNNLNIQINDKYSIAKKHSIRNRQIYIEKKFFKWSNAKISVKHDGISKRQINRIVKSYENEKQECIKNNKKVKNNINKC